jgi:hypothetical protein
VHIIVRLGQLREILASDKKEAIDDKQLEDGN